MDVTFARFRIAKDIWENMDFEKSTLLIPSRKNKKKMKKKQKNNSSSKYFFHGQ